MFVSAEGRENCKKKILSCCKDGKAVASGKMLFVAKERRWVEPRKQELLGTSALVE